MEMYSRYAALQTAIEARERAAQQAPYQTRREATAISIARPKPRLSRVIVAQLLKIIGVMNS